MNNWKTFRSFFSRSALSFVFRVKRTGSIEPLKKNTSLCKHFSALNLAVTFVPMSCQQQTQVDVLCECTINNFIE